MSLVFSGLSRLATLFFVNPYPAYAHTRFMRLSTFFGAGYAKKAAGTIGSIAALPIAFVLHALGSFFPIFGFTHWILLLAIVLVFPFALWATEATLKATGTVDPSFVVIDEVLGMWVALLFAPLSLWYYVACFIFFRLFDIFKPWLVGRAERSFSPAASVLMDDIVAGFFSLITTWFLALFFS